MKKWAVTHKEMSGNFIEGGKLESVRLTVVTLLVQSVLLCLIQKIVMGGNWRALSLSSKSLPNACNAEGIHNKTVKLVKDYISEFKAKKHIDLNKDIIVKYDFSDELSVVNTDKMVEWIVKKLALRKKLNILM